MHVADVIDQRREEIVKRFTDRLYASTAATSLSTADVIDSLREFLAELAAALRTVDGDDERVLTSHAAESHGKQRFGLGYEIAAVVREYAVLHDILLELLEESGAAVPVRQARMLARQFNAAVADGAHAYADARDRAQREQSEKHLGFLAHELRNPLSSMHLSIELGKKSGELGDGLSLQSLERGVARLRLLIDNALIEVRLRQGGSLQLQTVDIKAVLHDVAHDHAVHLGAKGLHLKVEAGDDVLVAADEKVLRSALANLVQNAVKFSLDRATITLRARAAEGRVFVEVEDGCGGLPPGTVEKLFDPFVQAGRDRSGFGLGLAIAKGAADSHGGEIRVHDLPGKGCVFLIELPQQQPAT